MKTAKILKKSVLTPGNNWITLLNSANLSKKNAVTPVLKVGGEFDTPVFFGFYCDILDNHIYWANNEDKKGADIKLSLLSCMFTFGVRWENYTARISLCPNFGPSSRLFFGASGFMIGTPSFLKKAFKKVPVLNVLDFEVTPNEQN